MNIFWFRRDLRLNDNIALHNALKDGIVQPIFIFDTKILDKLERNDARLSFIHKTLTDLNNKLKKYNSSIKFYYGDVETTWKKIIKTNVKKVFWNNDYEPYAIKRDKKIIKILNNKNIITYTFKDQVIFEKLEIVKKNLKPYTVFTPYKKKWLKLYSKQKLTQSEKYFFNFNKSNNKIIPLVNIRFNKSNIIVKPFSLSNLENYDVDRDYPYKDNTSQLSPHLRFGTISIRKCFNSAFKINQSLVSELIWREFFKNILYNFPYVETSSFKKKYNYIKWNNNTKNFKLWCNGQTGYPIIDAGMRQLNQTGYMHNRVRMITASFLIKHLLIDWKWGERYFASKLLDYDLSANNGNWQWASGGGCDAAPYFRIFNPTTQLKKFDSQLKYVKKWVPEILTSSYPKPIIDHKFARDRCLKEYKKIMNLDVK